VVGGRSVPAANHESPVTGTLARRWRTIGILSVVCLGFIGLLVSIIGLGAWRARAGSAKPIYVAVILDAAIVLAVVFYGVIAAVA